MKLSKKLFLGHLGMNFALITIKTIYNQEASEDTGSKVTEEEEPRTKERQR